MTRRRTLADVATLIRDQIPGYCITTESRYGRNALVVTWCTIPGVYVVWAVEYTRPAKRLLIVPPDGPVYTGRGWPERMARDIVAAVHEDARRNGRWGPERWGEVSNG